MKTVGELIAELEKLNPDTEIQLLNRGYNNIQVNVRKHYCCAGPYLVCEIFNTDDEE